MKTRWLDRRIAAPGPYIALRLSEEDFKAAVKHLCCANPGPWIKNDHSDATAHCLETSAGKTCVLVCIRGWKGRNAIEVAGLLVHEAVHIWQEYAASIGEQNPGIEQESYAVQSIAQELMAEFARRMEGTV